MKISLLVSDAALAEYFVTALRFAGHIVTLYPSKEDLVSTLFTDAYQHQPVSDEALLIELVLDEKGKRMIAELYRLAQDHRLPLIVLTTSDRGAIARAQDAFPGLLIEQLPILPGKLFLLIQTQRSSMSSEDLLSD